jgi:hypothetical protein
MSGEPTENCSRRIRELIDAADSFLGFLTLIAFPPNSRWEINGGRSVCSLADSLRSLEDIERPVQARCGMNELRRLLFASIERWGWEDIIRPDGDAFLEERERLWEENRRAYLGGVRSHVGAFCAGAISRKPGWAYFRLDRDAEAEGIPPTIPPVLTEEELASLHEAWILSPYLASAFPTLEEGEYVAIKSAIADIREGTRECLDRAPREHRQAAGRDSSGSEAPGSRAGLQARKVPRGELDERAVAMLLKNPTLTRAQLAEALGCRPGTLRDSEKCPKLAGAYSEIRAQRQTFREGSTWQDRRPVEDDA